MLVDELGSDLRDERDLQMREESEVHHAEEAVDRGRGG